MKLQFITIILAVVTLYSCGSSNNNGITDTTNSTNNPTTPTTNAITNSFWQLITLEGKNIPIKNNGEQKVGFTLNEKGNRITGFAGCNNFFGTYKLDAGDRISFSALGATKMACLVSDFNEADLLGAFELADNYRITGDKLELNVGKRAPLAVFKKVAATSEPITEKYWKLKTLEGQEVKMAKNQQKEIFFMLKNDENRVTGFAGCNTIMGSYTLEAGNRIRFSQMATTMMACPDVNFNESEFLKVFELADNYTITGDMLFLNVGRRAPLAVFEAVYFD